MADDTHRLQCPCCHNLLDFDSASGQVRAVDATAAPRAATDDRGLDDRRLENLVEKQQKDRDRVEDAFSRAARDAESQAEKFDDMFQAALDEAEKDEDKKPRNPFDMD